MKIHPKILFIADKWCAGNKKYGPSEWELGMQRSLESTGLADQEVFHFDDYFLKTGQKGDSALLQKISDYKPDLIYLITNKMPGSAFNVPEFATLDKIRNELKVKVAALFGDLAVSEQVEISLAIQPYVDLIIATELTAALNRINRPDKYIYMWVPRDPRIFNDPNKIRDIEVGYLGSPRKNRLARIRYLTNHGIKTVYGGGEGQEHLTTEQYADRYQRSKIALSFSRVLSSQAILARPFEAMQCGAMLLEQESFETMKLFIPFIDYVPYTTDRDMLKKAEYFLLHDEERGKIARNGREKMARLYSSKRFWQIVIDRTLGADLAGSIEIPYTFAAKIPAESLAALPPVAAFKMKFLNALCSTNFGFAIYRLFNPKFWQEVTLTTIAGMKPFLQKLLPRKLFDILLKIKRQTIKGDQ